MKNKMITVLLLLVLMRWDNYIGDICMSIAKDNLCLVFNYFFFLIK
jgi:hypothetical protein